ncbi:hypothetical protein QQP08_010115 [Theobroma cacao]|nr:hypothetical protein QQP08_010115 [Theobroma cacao]
MANCSADAMPSLTCMDLPACSSWAQNKVRMRSRLMGFSLKVESQPLQRHSSINGQEIRRYSNLFWVTDSIACCKPDPHGNI